MKFKFILIIFILFYSYSFGAKETQSAYYKEKQELLDLKDELNDFYEKKELEYQKNKAELEKIQQSIQKSEDSIKKIKAQNDKTLQEIKREITSKSMKLYDKMKLSVVINIFNEMINNGQIDEVFDIMIRMPDKRVMKIMKKLDTKTATLIMEKMRILKDDTTKNSK